jgi:hypothetical protein
MVEANKQVIMNNNRQLYKIIMELYVMASCYSQLQVNHYYSSICSCLDLILQLSSAFKAFLKFIR